MRVLIVEDQPMCAEVVRQFLEPYSSSIHYAETLEDAFRYAEKLQFDLIVLDLRLSDSTADNTIECIGELNALQSNCAIVVMSGMTPEDYFHRRSVAAGAQAFIPKSRSFTRNGIAIAIVAALRAKGLSDTNERIKANVELLEKLAQSPEAL